MPAWRIVSKYCLTGRKLHKVTKAKGRPQRESGLADMSVIPAQDDVRWFPDPNEVESWPVTMPLEGLGRINGRQGLHVESGRLIEFAMTAEIESGAVWYQVARVDTCHGEVHRHLFSHDGHELDRKVLFPIYDPKDVDHGWEEGVKLLVAGWEEHVRRWRSGH